MDTALRITMTWMTENLHRHVGKTYADKESQQNRHIHILGERMARQASAHHVGKLLMQLKIYEFQGS